MVICHACGRVVSSLRDHDCDERSGESRSHHVNAALAAIAAVDSDLRELYARDTEGLLQSERQRAQELLAGRRSADAAMRQMSDRLSECRRGANRWRAGAAKVLRPERRGGGVEKPVPLRDGAGWGTLLWPRVRVVEAHARQRAKERAAARIVAAEEEELKLADAPQPGGGRPTAADRLRQVYEERRMAHAHWTPSQRPGAQEGPARSAPRSTAFGAPHASWLETAPNHTSMSAPPQRHTTAYLEARPALAPPGAQP